MIVKPVLLASVAMMACASPPPPPPAAPPPSSPPPAFRIEDAAARISAQGEGFAQCFEEERYGIESSSVRLLFELSLPPAGGRPEVRVVEAGPASLSYLRDCLTEALRALEFPPHEGPVWKLQVPLEGHGY